MKPSTLKEDQLLIAHRNGSAAMLFSREYGTLHVTVMPVNDFNPRPDTSSEEQEWCKNLIVWQYIGEEEESQADDLFNKMVTDAQCTIIEGPCCLNCFSKDPFKPNKPGCPECREEASGIIEHEEIKAGWDPTP